PAEGADSNPPGNQQRRQNSPTTWRVLATAGEMPRGVPAADHAEINPRMAASQAAQSSRTAKIPDPQRDTKGIAAKAHRCGMKTRTLSTLGATHYIVLAERTVRC